MKLGPLLAVLGAAGALLLLGRRDKKGAASPGPDSGDGGGAPPGEDPGVPPGGGRGATGGKRVGEKPANLNARLDLLPEAVEQCVATEPAGSSMTHMKMCVLNHIFPEYIWPPPDRAWQWQRNLWSGVVGRDIENGIRGLRPGATS